MSPVHVSLTGDVRVALPPAEAFDLFTPEGERRWAEGWEPAWVHPASGALAPGAVFRTAHGGEETVWLVVDADRAAGRVRYVRDTPGNRIGTVEVRCAASPDGATIARVAYDLTALSPAGEAHLARFEREYADMMREWERDIAAALARERSVREER
jgi:hypothetical protein